MGDIVLRGFAKIGTEFFRQKKDGQKYQTFCRYGGEEFLAVVFDNKDTVYKIAEDFRRYTVETLQVKIKEQTKKDIPIITVSCGIAEYPKESKDFQSTYSLADIRLYQAKEQGRNKVVYK